MLQFLLEANSGSASSWSSYVSQQPWVFSGTVRSNILFGKKYEEERYEKVIKACALEEVSNDFLWHIFKFQIMKVLV